MKKINRSWIGKAIAIATFCFVMAFVFVPYTSFNSANAEDVSVKIGADILTLSMTTGTNEGNVAFNKVSPTTDGTFLLATKDIVVTTNAQYYAVYLASTTSDTTLCVRTSSGNCDGTSRIKSNGTANASWDEPQTFVTNDNYKNTWGYAVTKYHNNSSGEGDAWQHFTYGSRYWMNGSEYISSDDRTRGQYRNATFANVPAKGSDQKIFWQSTTLSHGWDAENEEGTVIVCTEGMTPGRDCNSEGPGKSTVYYGARVTNDLMMGEYTNQVVYTAVASLSDPSSGAQVAYLSPNYGGNGSKVNVSMNMTGSAGLTRNDVQVYFVDHATYEDHFADRLITTTELGYYGARCNIGSDDDIKAGTTGSDTGLQIACTVPDIGTDLGTQGQAEGKKIERGSASGNEGYDLVVIIPSYNLVYSTYQGRSTLGFKYVGMMDKDSENKYYVKFMQDMNPGICALTDGWDTTGWNIGSGTGTTAATFNAQWVGTGTPATIDSFDVNDAFFGTPSDVAGGYTKTMARNYDMSYTTVAEGGSMTKGQLWEKNMVEHKQRILIDNRDGKPYVVRKLADGQCWMTQNLDLDLQDNITLTSADTDLNTKTEWTPRNLGMTVKDTGSDPATYHLEEALVADSKVDTSPSRGTHIVTQKGDEYGTNGGKTWTWDQKGADGAHAYDLGPSYFKVNVPTVTRDGSGAITGNAPTIKTNSETGVVTPTSITYPTITSYGSNVKCPQTEVVSGTIYSNQTICKTGKDGEHLVEGMTSEHTNYYGTNAAGNYYNWYAATAGTGRADVSSSGGTYCDVEVEADGVTPKMEGGKQVCRKDAAGNDINAVVGGVAQDSICPRGWKLAGYDGKGSYKYLMDTYNMTDNDAGIQSAPLSFLRGGYYYYGNEYDSLINKGIAGYYWESKIYSDTYARYLYFGSANLNPQYTNSRGYGFSIRCVVQP